jgi:hypothetical protein
VAATDADCAKFPCTDTARCTAKEGRCVATSIDKCVAIGEANGCASAERCHIVDGECRAEITTDEDCIGVPCGHYGLCHAASGECVAKSADDCAFACEHVGTCTVRDGRCVAASSPECERSKGCQMGGRCHARQGECVALSDEDCAASTRCTEEGKCKMVLGICTSDESPPSDLL